MAETSRIWTIPNVISFLRLALIPAFGYLILTERDIAAIVVLVIAGLSDWLDGALARWLNQVTVLGRLLDPVADRLYIGVTLIALAIREFIPWWLVIVIALREIVLIVCQAVLRSNGYGFLQVNFAGKAATFALMYAFPLLLLGTLGGTLGYVATVVGWAFALWGVGLYWLSALIYAAQAIQAVQTAEAPA
ncbi:MAG TPA: CDP-alcohol phosphatidyltransferase family protein [Actinomycetaceae bacterium]|nr:CDP-alcohol phosphatidyltransferase family protein [Actinomycetaceae bacterium]